MTEEQIRELFTYHAPDEKKRLAHEQVNTTMLNIALWFYRMTPGSPEQTLAIRAIHRARVDMNTVVAMHGVNDEG